MLILGLGFNIGSVGGQFLLVWWWSVSCCLVCWLLGLVFGGLGSLGGLVWVAVGDL